MASEPEADGSNGAAESDLLFYAAPWSQLRPQLLAASSASQGPLLEAALLADTIDAPASSGMSTLSAARESGESKLVLCPLPFSPPLSVEQFADSIDFLCEIHALVDENVHLAIPCQVSDPLRMPNEAPMQLAHFVRDCDALALVLPTPTSMAKLQDGEWNWQCVLATLTGCTPLWITCSRNVAGELLSFLLNYGPAGIPSLISSPPVDGLPAKAHRGALLAFTDFLQRVVHTSPQLQPAEQATCWHVIGEMCVRTGQHSAAEECFRRSLSLCPPDSPTLLNADAAVYTLSLVHVLLHRQDYSSAEPLLQQVYDHWSERMSATTVPETPSPPESLSDGVWRRVLHYLVRCYLHDGRTPLAQVVYRQYLHSRGYDMQAMLPIGMPMEDRDQSSTASEDRLEVQETLLDLLQRLCADEEAAEEVQGLDLEEPCRLKGKQLVNKEGEGEEEDMLSPLMEEVVSPSDPLPALPGPALTADQASGHVERWEEECVEKEVDRHRLDAIPAKHLAAVLDVLHRLGPMLSRQQDWSGAWQTLRHRLFLQRRVLLLQGEQPEAIDRDESVLSILQAMASLCMRHGRGTLAYDLWEAYLRHSQPSPSEGPQDKLDASPPPSSLAVDDAKAVRLLTAHYHLAQLAGSRSAVTSPSPPQLPLEGAHADLLPLDEVWTRYQACLSLCLSLQGRLPGHPLVGAVLSRMLRVLCGRLAQAARQSDVPIPPSHTYHLQTRQVFFLLLDHHRHGRGGLYHAEVLRQMESFVQYAERHSYVDDSVQSVFLQARDIQTHLRAVSTGPSVTTPPLAEDLLYRLARLYRKAGRPHLAVRYYVQLYHTHTAISPPASLADRALLCQVLLTVGQLLQCPGEDDPQQAEDYLALAWQRCQQWLGRRHPLRTHILQTLAVWHSQRLQHTDTMHYGRLLLSHWGVDLWPSEAADGVEDTSTECVHGAQDTSCPKEEEEEEEEEEKALSSPLPSLEHAQAVVSVLHLYAQAAEAIQREDEALRAYQCIVSRVYTAVSPRDTDSDDVPPREAVLPLLRILPLLARRPDRRDELLRYAGLVYRYYLPRLRLGPRVPDTDERVAHGAQDEGASPAPLPAEHEHSTAVQVASLYADQLFAAERYGEARDVYAALYTVHASSLAELASPPLSHSLSYSCSPSPSSPPSPSPSAAVESPSPMSVSQHGRDSVAERTHSVCITLLYRQALCCQYSQQVDQAERLYLQCVHQSGFPDITYEGTQHVDVTSLPVWIMHPRSAPSPGNRSTGDTSFSLLQPTLALIVSALTQLYALYRSQARPAQAIFVLHHLYDLQCQHYLLHGSLLSATAAASPVPAAGEEGEGEACSEERPGQADSSDALWELGGLAYALGTLYIKCAGQLLAQTSSTSPIRPASSAVHGSSPSPPSPLPPTTSAATASVPARAPSPHLATPRLAMDSPSAASSLSTIHPYLSPQTVSQPPDVSAPASHTSLDTSSRMEEDGPAGRSVSLHGDGASDGEDSDLTVLAPNQLRISTLFHLADHYFHQHLLLVYPSGNSSQQGVCRAASFQSKVQALTSISQLFLSVQHAIRAVPYLEACYDAYQQPWEGTTHCLDRNVADILQSLLTQYVALGMDEQVDRTYQRLIDFYSRKYSPNDLLVLKTCLRYGHVLFSRNQLDAAMEQYAHARNLNVLYSLLLRLRQTHFSMSHDSKPCIEASHPPGTIPGEGEGRAHGETSLATHTTSGEDFTPGLAMPLLFPPPSTMTASVTQSTSSSPVLPRDQLATHELVHCITQLEQSISTHLRQQDDPAPQPEDRSCQAYLVLLMQSLLHCGRCAQRMHALTEAEEDYLLALQVYRNLAVCDEFSPLSPPPACTQSSLTPSTSPLSHVGGNGREECKELHVLVQHNLAVLYVKTQRYGKAEELFQAVYQHKLTLSSLGGPLPSPGETTTTHKEQLSLCSAMNDLAGVLTIGKKYAEAEPLYVRIYEIRLALLGPQHYDTLLSLLNLAYIQQKLGQHSEAKNKYEACLAGSLQALGEQHVFIEKVRLKYATLEVDRRLALRATRLANQAKGEENKNVASADGKELRPTPLSLTLPEELQTPPPRERSSEMGCCCTN